FGSRAAPIKLQAIVELIEHDIVHDVHGAGLVLDVETVAMPAIARLEAIEVDDVAIGFSADGFFPHRNTETRVVNRVIDQLTARGEGVNGIQYGRLAGRKSGPV